MSRHVYYSGIGDSLAVQLIAVKWLFVVIMSSGEGKSVWCRGSTLPQVEGCSLLQALVMPLHNDKIAVRVRECSCCTLLLRAFSNTIS